LCIPTA